MDRCTFLHPAGKWFHSAVRRQRLPALRSDSSCWKPDFLRSATWPKPYCTALEAPASVINCVTWRPLSGKSTTLCELTTWPTPVEEVSIIAAAASTCTIWLTAPTFSTGSMVGPVGDLQNDARLKVRGESFLLDLHLVGTDWQAWQRIHSARIGRCGPSRLP